MRTLVLSLALIVCVSFFTSNLRAQDDAHIYTVTIFYTSMPDDGRGSERDSMLTWWSDNIVKKNPKILSERVLRHYWTENSREWMVISEYMNWGDVDAAGTMSNELMEKAMPDEKKRQAWNRRFGEYFPSHSDRIMNEVKSNRK